MSEQQIEQPVIQGQAPVQKTPEQLLQQQKLKQQEQRQKQQERKRLQQQARVKRQEDIKKLQQALKGSLSGLGKTNNNQTMAYLKINLAQKQLQRVFPSVLKYKQIRYLDINTNSISDPSILTQFQFLVSLNLSKNQISSIQCFNNDNLTNLQILNLSGNKLKVLSDIKLNSLRRLNLNENQISQVQWKGHSTIQILQLRKNKLRKLRGISNMKKLRELYVCQNQITDIRGLQNVNQLEKLYLRNNKIKTFMSPFPHLPKIQYLNMRQNQLSSLQELKKLPTHIKKINFMANPLADQLGQNLKKQVVWQISHIVKVNKSEITVAERLQFEKQWLQKQAERQKERLQKEAIQQQARRVQQQARRVQQQARRVQQQAKRVQQQAKKAQQQLKRAQQQAKKVEQQGKKAPQQEANKQQTS